MLLLVAGGSGEKGGITGRTGSILSVVAKMGTASFPRVALVFWK